MTDSCATASPPSPLEPPAAIASPPPVVAPASALREALLPRLALLLSGLIAAGTFIVAKDATARFTPIELTCLRVTLSFVIVAPIFFCHAPRPPTAGARRRPRSDRARTARHGHQPDVLPDRHLDDPPGSRRTAVCVHAGAGSRGGRRVARRAADGVEGPGRAARAGRRGDRACPPMDSTFRPLRFAETC